MNGRRLLLALGLTAGLVGAAGAVPYPSASTPASADLGTARAVLGNESITATVALQLRNTTEMQALLVSVYNRGGPQFRHFLSKDEFDARFGPSDTDVAQVTQRLEKAGLQVTRTGTTFLRVTGSTAAMEAAFAVSLHAYQVPASVAGPGYRFRAPTSAPQAPADIGSAVQAVLGLNTRPHFRPHLRAALGKGTAVRLPATAAPQTPDPPGLWTVADFAQYYDVQPLYNKGLLGRRQTLGIVTLASFTPSDAFAYWNSLGLSTSKTRIKVVNVDGGSGPPSDASGSVETTLDVEQSGGIAPSANIIVYEAPNTDQGFLDAFAAAFDANTADTISTSWGEWEYFDTIDSVTDPLTHRNTDFLVALNDLLIQAALQGQSVFAASGDSGAYDANDPVGSFPLPGFSQTISVDAPASQPLITAAGGTTLPGTQSFLLNDGSTFSVTIPTERAWSWDYLTQLCSQLGFDPISCGIFPAGDGGGVSVFFPRPFYQFFVPGVRNSEPGQALVDETQTPPQLIFKLPANFPGRNVPDISLNADPDTGYVVFYTSDVTGFGVQSFFGGTSFVAPQLNGMTALFTQGLGGRVGLLNTDLYDLVLLGHAYGGRHPPLRDITSGNNWFYKATPGYDQATGVGVPDIANLFNALY
jgi:subtilase family serine protease